MKLSLNHFARTLGQRQLRRRRNARQTFVTESLESRILLTSLQGDFNGDGYADLAIGVPHESVNGDEEAGAVNVLYGTSSGLSDSNDEMWHQDSDDGTEIRGGSEEGDHFGEVVAIGDFDNDGYDDLAIGVPFEDLDGYEDAGAVNVIYGSRNGLTGSGNQMWHQDQDGVRGAVEEGDRFGQALAVGDFDNDGYDDLAIGIPMEDIDAVQNAGAVAVLYGSSSGLTATGDDFWSQDGDVAGADETNDRFGWSLAVGDFDGDNRDDLAIGVPLEDTDGTTDTGAVNVLYGASEGLTTTGDQMWYQDLSSLNGDGEYRDRFGFSLTAGDYDGDGRDDLAVGIPYENVSGTRDAGAVQVIYGSSSGLTSTGDEIWHQDVSGIAGDVEHRDQFGFSLASGDFDDDGRDDLAIGVPKQEVSGADEAGAVHVIYGSSSGLTTSGDAIITQVLAEDGDQFGYGVTTADFDNDGYTDLGVGAPFEDIGSSTIDAGSVSVYSGSGTGLATRGLQAFSQDGDVAGADENNDRFGFFHGGTLISNFDIDVVFNDNGLTDSQKQIFIQAADRWSEVILGELTDQYLAGYGYVDDLLIGVTAPYIDGSGGTLGSAGPTYLRSSNDLPYYGTMKFDCEDIEDMENDGSLINVILHEMGHVLGIGTLWQTFGMVDYAGTAYSRYRGSAAINQYNDIFSNSYSYIPLETTGGAGTADGHWAESDFNNEVMTGYLDSGDNPLSRVTVGSLNDLGYTADYDAADLYTPPASATGGGSSSGAIRKETETTHSKYDPPLEEPTRRSSLKSDSSTKLRNIDVVFTKLGTTHVSTERADTHDDVATFDRDAAQRIETLDTDTANKQRLAEDVVFGSIASGHKVTTLQVDMTPLFGRMESLSPSLIDKR